MERNHVLSFNDGLDLILKQTQCLGAQVISLQELVADGSPAAFVLNEDVRAQQDLPAWDNAAMDGFALFGQEGIDQFPIIGEVAAGSIYSKPVPAGKAIAIFTGAPVPNDCDRVIPVENVKPVENDKMNGPKSMKILSPHTKGQHIRYQGEDLKVGDTVFSKGTPLTPTCLGVLASLGQKNVQVIRKPRVSFLTTGSELVALNESPKKGQIFDSNSFLIESLLKGLGCETLNLGICPDDPDSLRHALSQGFENSDVLITCGGVSVGTYDYIQQVLTELGGEISFWKLAMKPGKPFAYGHHDARAFFALPGNPVAVAVTFEELVRPALLKMMGHEKILRLKMKAIAKEPLKGSKSRTTFHRVNLHNENNQWYCRSSGKQGSHILRSMATCDGIAVIPPDCLQIEKGQEVWVQYLNALG